MVWIWLSQSREPSTRRRGHHLLASRLVSQRPRGRTLCPFAGLPSVDDRHVIGDVPRSVTVLNWADIAEAT